VSFKPGSEDCYGKCGSDKIWQTVPDTCSGDRESSVTDSREFQNELGSREFRMFQICGWSRGLELLLVQHPGVVRISVPTLSVAHWKSFRSCSTFSALASGIDI